MSVKKDRDEKSLSFCNVGAFIERPRANSVRPYRVLDNFSAKNITHWCVLFLCKGHVVAQGNLGDQVVDVGVGIPEHLGVQRHDVLQVTLEHSVLDQRRAIHIAVGGLLHRADHLIGVGRVGQPVCLHVLPGLVLAAGAVLLHGIRGYAHKVASSLVLELIPRQLGKRLGHDAKALLLATQSGNVADKVLDLAKALDAVLALLSSLMAVGAALGVYLRLSLTVSSMPMALFPALLTAGAVYLVTSCLLGVIRDEDVRLLPFGEGICRILKRVHLLPQNKEEKLSERNQIP